MSRHYVPTGRPRGRPRKDPSQLVRNRAAPEAPANAATARQILYPTKTLIAIYQAVLASGRDPAHVAEHAARLAEASWHRGYLMRRHVPPSPQEAARFRYQLTRRLHETVEAAARAVQRGPLSTPDIRFGSVTVYRLAYALNVDPNSLFGYDQEARERSIREAQAVRARHALALEQARARARERRKAGLAHEAHTPETHTPEAHTPPEPPAEPTSAPATVAGPPTSWTPETAFQRLLAGLADPIRRANALRVLADPAVRTFVDPVRLDILDRLAALP